MRAKATATTIGNGRSLNLRERARVQTLGLWPATSNSLAATTYWCGKASHTPSQYRCWPLEMAENSLRYRTKELEERRLASLAQGEAQVIHRLSADLYAELYRQVSEQESAVTISRQING